jgi:hypothetical protein
VIDPGMSLKSPRPVKRLLGRDKTGPGDIRPG